MSRDFCEKCIDGCVCNKRQKPMTMTREEMVAFVEIARDDEYIYDCLNEAEALGRFCTKAADIIDQLLSELDALKAQSEWQPIDENLVIGRGYKVGRWRGNDWVEIYAEYQHGYWSGMNDNQYPIDRFTHYYPIETPQPFSSQERLTEETEA